MTDDPLDTNALDTLTDMLGGDAELVREMIDTFAEEVPARLARPRLDLPPRSDQGDRKRASN